MNYLKQSLTVEMGNAAVAWAHLTLRVAAGLMIFYIHGFQNVLAGRDPQLSILYTLIVATLALMDSGRYSLGARLESHTVSKNT